MKPENALLAALPPSERERIEVRAEHASLAQGQIIGAPGDEIRAVYFPLDSVIALTAEDESLRHALALDLIGREGMLGAPLVLGAKTSPLRIVVQNDGGALRLGTDEFLRLLPETPALERGLERQLDRVYGQFARSAVCASFHLVVTRLATWLLMTHDRSPGDRFYLTHDLLARLLGVRRSGVTAAAGVLQKRNLIAYTRGRVLVLDRKGLEREACACYAHARAALEVPLAAPRDAAAEVRPLRVAQDSEPRTVPIREPRRWAGGRR